MIGGCSFLPQDPAAPNRSLVVFRPFPVVFLSPELFFSSIRADYPLLHGVFLSCTTRLPCRHIKVVIGFFTVPDLATRRRCRCLPGRTMFYSTVDQFDMAVVDRSAVPYRNPPPPALTPMQHWAAPSAWSMADDAAVTSTFAPGKRSAPSPDYS